MLIKMFSNNRLTKQDEIEDTQIDQIPPEQQPKRNRTSRVIITFTIIFGLWLSAFLTIKFNRSIGLDTQIVKSYHGIKVTCRQPIQRKEWRELNIEERDTYLSAVLCLWNQPSKLGLNHTLYEDFSWIHSRLGNFSHNTPSFIAWHRYFLHIYERTLQRHCGYKGQLTYWDWSLDYKSMKSSPIWDLEYGFGGDGNSHGPKSVGGGHCVTDGPFANKTILYFGSDTVTHCLSRGFAQEKYLHQIFGQKVHQSSLEAVLSQTDYEGFNRELENGPHNAIPRAIRGDFLRVTAPNDPVFFLHHTQLDRLWWLWQRRAPDDRVKQYGISKHGEDGAMFREIFHFQDFAPDIQAWELLSTESDILCYVY